MLADDGVMDGENTEEIAGFQNIMPAENDDVMDGENECRPVRRGRKCGDGRHNYADSAD
jgi:hypothetical protein